MGFANVITLPNVNQSRNTWNNNRYFPGDVKVLHLCEREQNRCMYIGWTENYTLSLYLIQQEIDLLVYCKSLELNQLI